MKALHGFGLRVPHYERLLLEGAGVPVVEALSENFLGRGGRAFAVLERLRVDAEVVLHGVSMSVFDLDPLDEHYLADLRELATRIEARVVSDHASYGRVAGLRGYDLWPLPRTAAVLAHAVPRIHHVQERLGRRLVLENPSTYVSFRSDTLAPWEFWSELLRQSGCGMLLDLNNVVVDARNHGFAPEDFVDHLPIDGVVQFHLGGHDRRDRYSFDDHASPVPEDVWSLFRRALRRFGHRPTIVEWDENVPSIDRLREEARRIVHEAERAREEVLRRPEIPVATGGNVSGAISPVGDEKHHAHALGESAPCLGLSDLVHAWWVAMRTEPGPAELPRQVTGADGLAPEEGIALYRRMFWYRQVDALIEVFPRTARVLGGRVFTERVCRFLQAVPGSHWGLERLGRHLADWLAEAEPRGSPWLDLTRLEWARADVLLSPDPPEVLRAMDLSVHRFPEAIVRFVPGLRALRVAASVVASWSSIDPGAPLEAGPSFVLEEEDRSSPLVVVSRAGFAVEHRPLAEPEASAFQVAMSGAPLATVCACFEHEDEPARRAASALSAWIDRAWIAELTPASEAT